MAPLKSQGFRKDYSVGEKIRSPSHMITTPTSKQAFQLVSTMQKHDFAFVKRSDGSFSYAILAFRSLEPSTDGRKTLEEFMTFVVDFDRTIKIFKKKEWVEYIRPVKTRGSDRKYGQSKTHTTQMDEWVPSIISFVPAGPDEGDDLSLL